MSSKLSKNVSQKGQHLASESLSISAVISRPLANQLTSSCNNSKLSPFNFSSSLPIKNASMKLFTVSLFLKIPVVFID